ncbi:hypothetical protein PMAYCL1PPCAC_01906, partial [Pristionchus mayeri]
HHPHDVGAQLGDPPEGIHVIWNRYHQYGDDGRSVLRLPHVLHVFILEGHGDSTRHGQKADRVHEKGQQVRDFEESEE